MHFGKPCITGTRITVQDVLELVREGIAFREIIQEYYPELTVEDIRASIQYAIALVAAGRMGSGLQNSILADGQASDLERLCSAKIEFCKPDPIRLGGPP